MFGGAPKFRTRISESPRLANLEFHQRRYAHIVRDAENEKLARAWSLGQTAAASRSTDFAGGWALRGFAGILLAAGIGVAAVHLVGSSGDAAKTASSQPPPLAQTAPTAALSPELTPLLQSMSRDLASMGKEIEQLKADRELVARDNANLSEQFKASQEQLTRAVARLSEQLKASQEQAVRDNANVAEQIKGIQEQLTGVISRASEQNAPPRIARLRHGRRLLRRGQQFPRCASQGRHFRRRRPSPAEGRKAKTVIDVAAAGARALGPFLHGPVAAGTTQAANSLAFIKAVLLLAVRLCSSSSRF